MTRDSLWCDQMGDGRSSRRENPSTPTTSDATRDVTEISGIFGLASCKLQGIDRLKAFGTNPQRLTAEPR
jgi:hypothetical protein